MPLCGKILWQLVSLMFIHLRRGAIHSQVVTWDTSAQVGSESCKTRVAAKCEQGDIFKTVFPSTHAHTHRYICICVYQWATELSFSYFDTMNATTLQWLAKFCDIWLLYGFFSKYLCSVKSWLFAPATFLPGKFQTSSTCCWCFPQSHNTLCSVTVDATDSQPHHLQLGVPTSWSSLVHQDLRGERNIFREHQRPREPNIANNQRWKQVFNKKQRAHLLSVSAKMHPNFHRIQGAACHINHIVLHIFVHLFPFSSHFFCFLVSYFLRTFCPS